MAAALAKRCTGLPPSLARAGSLPASRSCSKVHFRAPCRLEERDDQQEGQGNAGRGLPGETAAAATSATATKKKKKKKGLHHRRGRLLPLLPPPPPPLSRTVSPPTPAAAPQIYNPKQKLQQVFVIVLGRAGEDNRSFRLTNVDSTLSGFAGADYDMLVGAGCLSVFACLF